MKVIIRIWPCGQVGKNSEESCLILTSASMTGLTWAYLDARCPKAVLPVGVGSELVGVGVVEHEPWTCVLTCPFILEVLTGLQNTKHTNSISHECTSPKVSSLLLRLHLLQLCTSLVMNVSL